MAWQYINVTWEKNSDRSKNKGFTIRHVNQLKTFEFFLIENGYIFFSKMYFAFDVIYSDVSNLLFKILNINNARRLTEKEIMFRSRLVY